jgi:hypothetical protein
MRTLTSAQVVARMLLHACRDSVVKNFLACRGSGQINSSSYTCCQFMVEPRSWAQGYLRARPRVQAQKPSLMQARLSLCVVVLFKLFGVRKLWSERSSMKSVRWAANEVPIRRPRTADAEQTAR